jgi:hypothetical protein
LSLLLLAILLLLASLAFHPSVAGVPNIRYFRKYWQHPIFAELKSVRRTYYKK